MLFLNTERKENEISPVRIGFSVPKKKFKKAVLRNKYKRLLKDAWRLQKGNLYPLIPTNSQLHIFLIYTGDSEQPFEIIQSAVIKGIEQLKKQFSENG